MKRCSKCKEEKPFGSFYKAKRYIDGLDCWCITCRRNYHKTEAGEQVHKRHKQSEKGKANNRRYNQSEKAKSNHTKYNTSNKGKERTRFWREQNKEKISIYHKKYLNSEKGRAYCQARKARRRALKMGAEGSYTAREWKLLVEEYYYACANCHRLDVELTADHIIPLSRGGTNHIDNIQPLCRSCNSRKNNMLPKEFYLYELSYWYS